MAPDKMNPKAFAHYFTWFANKAVSGHWEHWNWDGPGSRHDPDQIINGRPDIAAIDVPLIGAYDSSDPAVQLYHLDLAEAAGIDAFCVDWYGMSEKEQNRRDQLVNDNLVRMFQTASAHHIKLCVCYEERLLVDHVSSEAEAIEVGRYHFQYIASRFFSSPAHWYVDQRPVIIIWGNNRLAPHVWKEVFKEVEPYHPWILYSHHEHRPVYAEICHGFYPWVLIGDLDFQKAYLDEFYHAAQRYVRTGASVTLGGGVWPGFNDSGVYGWGSGTRLIEDSNDELFDLTWQYVLENRPEWISITTWNDWNEGTNIEPGIKQGTKYLQKTAEYLAQLRGLGASSDIDTVVKNLVLRE